MGRRLIQATLFKLGALTVAWPLLAKSASKQLPLPGDKETIETAVSSVTAPLVKDQRWYAAVRREPLWISNVFAREETERQKRFGSLIDTARFPIQKMTEGSDWYGIADAGRGALLLDGANLILMAAEWESGKEISRQTLAWDALKPPRDRGGEGTQREVAAFRRRFENQLKVTDDLKFVGLARIPKEWVASSYELTYIVSTRVPGFPLLAVGCSESSLTSCVVVRGCDVEGAKDLLPSSISGVAVSQKRRRVLVGDQTNHRIAQFSFHSCQRVVRGDDLLLPERLKTVGGLFIDAQDGLWVSTLDRDDFANASVFHWSDW